MSGGQPGPGDTRRSDCSPGTSNVAVALPAGGTGSTKEPRPGEVVMAEPHSSVAANVAGPVTIATCGVALGEQRQRTIAGASVEQRRLADERYLHGSSLKHLAVDGHGRADGSCRDAYAQIRARQRGGQRGAVWRTWLPRREIEQAIVVRPRERDGSRGSAFLSRCDGREEAPRSRDDTSRRRRLWVMSVSPLVFEMANAKSACTGARARETATRE